ncbi:MAG: hypothetical protein K0R09_3158 [Clostridiales bacterium]|nr:hypothetical protein [Clostridiales bacterium]
MKPIKAFTLFIIALCTALAILYLIFQTKKLERYTGIIDYEDKCYILFSTDGGKLSNGKSIQEILSFSADFLKQSGIDAVMVEETKNNKIKSKILDLMKRDRKYIMIDINPTNLITNENTILIRLGKKDNAKYETNLEYASKLKETITSKYSTIKVNLLSDSKNNYNQDLGNTAIRLDIPQTLSYESAKILMSYILETLTQLE